MQETPSRRTILKGIGAVALVFAVPALGQSLNTRLPEANTSNVSFREQIMQLRWDGFNKLSEGVVPEELHSLSQAIAEKYIALTGVDVDADYLVDKTHFYSNRNDWMNAICTSRPNFQPNRLVVGFSDHVEKQVHIDLEHFQDTGRGALDNPGIKLINLLFHEWTHLTAETQSRGQFLNNPDFVFNYDGREEEWKFYRGLLVAGDSITFFGLANESMDSTLVHLSMLNLLEEEDLPREDIRIVLEGDGNYVGVKRFLEDIDFSTITLDHWNRLYRGDLERFVMTVGSQMGYEVVDRSQSRDYWNIRYEKYGENVDHRNFIIGMAYLEEIHRLHTSHYEGVDLQKNRLRCSV